MVVQKVVRVNADIIKVEKAENVQEHPKAIINKASASCSGIGKSEGHNKEFKQAVTGLKCYFPFVTILDPNQVVCRSEI